MTIFDSIPQFCPHFCGVAGPLGLKIPYPAVYPAILRDRRLCGSPSSSERSLHSARQNGEREEEEVTTALVKRARISRNRKSATTMKRITTTTTTAMRKKMAMMMSKMSRETDKALRKILEGVGV